MTYDYQCPKCKEVFEIEHPMSDVENPSAETLKKITCPSFGECPNGNKNVKKVLIFERVYLTSPRVGSFESKSPVQRQNILAKRSQAEAKKNSDRKESLSGRFMKEAKDIAKGKS